MHFCTLFDSNYLTRGLAMYRSLARTSPNAHLYVYAFDDGCRDILRRLALPRMTVVSLAEFENERLLAVKPTRSRGEYCWTCTSHIIRHALDTFSLPAVTYLDADLFFFADPKLLIDEFDRSGASVLLTEHRYSPPYDQSQESGIYCVQFMGFRADARGLEALSWWQERCLEWCYNRVEDGKFGDQKYLDDWLTRFAGVHVLQHPGGGVAPWNIQQYRLERDGEAILGNGVPLVFYHFHDYKFYEDGSHSLGDYRLGKTVVDFLYRPYVRAMAEVTQAVRGQFPDFAAGSSRRETKLTKPFWNLLYRLKGTYNVYRSL